jgi:predicted phosphohydrolase
MNSPPTADALLGLVHRFYPAGVHRDDPRYPATEEHQRLDAVMSAAAQDSTAWSDFLRLLERELPGSRVWDYPTLRYDPCRCARVALPASPLEASDYKAVVLLVSVLTPVHLLYACHQRLENRKVVESATHYPPLPAEFFAYETRMDELVRATLGTVRLSNEVLFTPVPDVQVGNTAFGKVVLADCLFTDHRW